MFVENPSDANSIYLSILRSIKNTLIGISSSVTFAVQTIFIYRIWPLTWKRTIRNMAMTISWSPRLRKSIARVSLRRRIKERHELILEMSNDYEWIKLDTVTHPKMRIKYLLLIQRSVTTKIGSLCSPGSWKNVTDSKTHLKILIICCSWTHSVHLKLILIVFRSSALIMNPNCLFCKILIIFTLCY